MFSQLIHFILDNYRGDNGSSFATRHKMFENEGILFLFIYLHVFVFPSALVESYASFYYWSIQCCFAFSISFILSNIIGTIKFTYKDI